MTEATPDAGTISVNPAPIDAGVAPDARSIAYQYKPDPDAEYREAARLRIERGYLADLKRCQKKFLGEGQSVKVMLRLTITEQGRVTDASADSDHAELSACVLDQMVDWTFYPPKDAEHEPTTATIEIGVMFVAE